MSLLNGLLRRVAGGRGGGGLPGDTNDGRPGVAAEKTRGDASSDASEGGDAFWGDRDAGDDDPVLMLHSMEELEQILKGGNTREELLDAIVQRTQEMLEGLGMDERLQEVAEAVVEAEAALLRPETEGAGPGTGDRESPLVHADLGDLPQGETGPEPGYHGDPEPGSLQASESSGGGQDPGYRGAAEEGLHTEGEPEVEFFEQETGDDETREEGGEAFEEVLLDSASLPEQAASGLPDQATTSLPNQATGEDSLPNQEIGEDSLPNQATGEEQTRGVPEHDSQDARSLVPPGDETQDGQATDFAQRAQQEGLVAGSAHESEDGAGPGDLNSAAEARDAQHAQQEEGAHGMDVA